MHKAIFKNRFVNNACTISNGIYGHKLGLHISRKARKWLSNNIYRFWPAASHI